jgi:filamentous hemagglutinin family protein
MNHNPRGLTLLQWGMPTLWCAVKKPSAAGRGVVALVLLLPALLPVAVRAEVAGGGLGTRVNNDANGGCRSGHCAVSGGTTAGSNLFHRFRHFDTRGGITGVGIDTQGRQNVIVGVSDRQGTFLDKTLSLSGKANLFWLSPGGIWLGPGAQVTNVSNLLLTTATSLRIGGSEYFHATNTDAAAAALLTDAPQLSWQGLKTTTGTLDSLGFGGINGPIVLAGGRLQVDRSLILDAGNGVIRSEAGSGSGLSAALVPPPDQGIDQLRLGARSIDLSDIELSSGLPGRRGAIDLQASEGLMVNQGHLEGKQLLLRGSTVTVNNRSELIAPKGLIHLESQNPGDSLSVTDSTLDGGWRTPEDLTAKVIFLEYQNGATVESTDQAPLIGLFSQGNIQVTGSFLKASQELTAQDLASLSKEFPSTPVGPIRLNDTSGNVVLAAEGAIVFRRSEARADASHTLAGNIGFQARGRGGILIADESRLSASGGAASGDIRLSSADGIDLRDSLLTAESSHSPPLEVTESGDLGWSTASFSGGEITLTNSSATAGITIQHSRLNASYHTEAGPLSNLSYMSSNTSLFQDKFDGNDGGEDPDSNNRVLGGKIWIASSGGIRITDRSTLNVDSTSGSSSRLEGFGGSIRLMNLSPDSQRALAIDGSSLLTARIGGNTESTPKDTLNDYYFGHGGRIALWSEGDVKIENANLDASSTNPIPRELGYPFGDPEFRGSIQILSKGKQRFQGATLNIGGDAGSGAGPGMLQLRGYGEISAVDSSIVDGRTATEGMAALDGSIEIRTASPASDASYFRVLPDGSGRVAIAPPVALEDVQSDLPSEFKERLGTLDGIHGGIKLDGKTATDTALEEKLVSPSRQVGLVDGYAIIVEQGGNLPGEQSILLLTMPPEGTTRSIRVTADNASSGSTASPFPWEPPPRDWWSITRSAQETASGNVAAPLANGNGDGIPVFGQVGSPATPVASLAGASAIDTAQLPSPLQISPVRKMGVSEASERFAKGEQLALQSTLATLDMQPAPGIKVPSVASLQKELQGTQALLAQQKLPTRGGRGHAPASYSPAILSLSTWPLPSGELLLDAILIPPSGPLQGWQRQVRPEELHRLIGAVQRQMSRMEELGPDYRSPEAGRLASLLLADVLPVLQREQITALLVSADRKLQAIPFAALPLQEGLLGQSFALTITPSLGLTDLAPPERAAQAGASRILLAGASHFRSGLVPLPLVKQELQAIAGNQPADLLLDERFNASELQARLREASYSGMHIASHAEFTPDKTGLGKIYTTNGELNLSSLRHGRSLPDRLDLVSLSACRTALGDEVSELGLLGMALKIGGRSGLGTLWTADDAGNAAFFIQFYRYLRGGMTKDLALQATRQAFANGEIRVSGSSLVGPEGQVLISNLSRGDQARYKEGLSHPYYWAGVLLTGSPW